MEFTGRSSNTYRGELKHRKLCAKKLKLFALPELGVRDVVSCFKQYLRLVQLDGPFYRRPFSNTVLPSFTKQIVGKNKHQIMTKEICAKAGLEGYFASHSGKVTCATELFNNNIDKQLIQGQTGHHSNADVRAYKRPGDKHFQGSILTTSTTSC